MQEELEKAIERITQQPARVVAAGRTDAGVHATGQVIHFLSAWPHPPGDLQRAMNAVLPKTVAVADLGYAASEFHARYSARSRRYRYDIINCETRSPITHRFALHRSRPLDAAVMHDALQYLGGTHDFRAFAAGEPANLKRCTQRVERFLQPVRRYAADCSGSKCVLAPHDASDCRDPAGNRRRAQAD